MELRSGWLERSLERARANIEDRPEHLKPEWFRSEKEAPKAASKKKRQPSEK
jgi:hypothetical protein